MKKNLNEELERMYVLAYGENIVKEGFIQNILSKFKKIDDPKRADFVFPNVDDFYQTLQDSAAQGGLSQQKSGSMEYQKGVESMQIGLLLLGFELPRFGVDGLFGPETASAVKKFNQSYPSTKNLADENEMTLASREMLIKLIGLLKEKNITSKNLLPYIDMVISGGGDKFTDLDLSTPDGIKKYSEICQKFIDSHRPNPLNITGMMLAKGAELAFRNHRKYIPPELALSQLLLEGGIGNNDVQSRPIRTKNPFNVENYDVGRSDYYDDVQIAINRYYTLISTNYLSGGKTASDLAQNFVNKNNNRYASDRNYENKLNSIASEANKISQSVTSFA